MNCQGKDSRPNIKWKLVGYDLFIYVIAVIMLLGVYGGMDKLSVPGMVQQTSLSAASIFAARFLGKVYKQVWRYGGIQCYIRLLFTDMIAFIIYLCMELLFPVQKVTFARMLSLVSVNLLGALAIRMVYRYAYKCGKRDTIKGKILLMLLHTFYETDEGSEGEIPKIKAAIVGAGRVGVSLAEEFLNNTESSYVAKCFIDIDKAKVGREIHGIPVWPEGKMTFERLKELEVQEIIFAIPSMDTL